MGEHTKGPWQFEPHNLWGYADPDEGEYPIGYISTAPLPQPIFALHVILEFPSEELRANARLIAAAPDLLEALIACRDQFQFYHDEHNRAGKHEKAATNIGFVDLANAAIARATEAHSREEG